MDVFRITVKTVQHTHTRTCRNTQTHTHTHTQNSTNNTHTHTHIHTQTHTQELVPGGSKIQVTEANKRQYVDLIARHHMTTSIKQQINAVLEGFWQLVPRWGETRAAGGGLILFVFVFVRVYVCVRLSLWFMWEWVNRYA